MEVLTIIAAVVTAIVLIVGIIRVSWWLTSRKSAAELKKQRPDASSVNGDGYTS
jgi:flagellar basal body-associated protein FliL